MKEFVALPSVTLRAQPGLLRAHLLVNRGNRPPGSGAAAAGPVRARALAVPPARRR